MVKKILISLIFLFSIFEAFAQSGKISGMVYSNGEPVLYATVSIQAISKFAVTDSLGKFVLANLPNGNYQLLISRVGFAEQTKNIRITNNGEVKLSINLIQNLYAIKSITINANKEYQGNKISKLDLQLRPVSSSQDLLRLVPGLFIAQHAGGGKAEQIFMRGFDIDHGTDFAIYVDGMPVNMTSHAHGQGYADLHFLIPETVKELEVNKGPHTTKYGDLATAGSGEFKTLNSLDRNLIKLEYGMFDTKRALGMINLLGGTKHLFSKKKENLFTAIEYRYTNSYTEQKQKFNRFNILTKYTGELNNGNKLSISLSSFQSSWDASGQIPVRKVADGTITRFGSIDPTEGGKTGRSNFNIIHEKKLKNSSLKNQFYYSRYDFNLYSNFTFYLNDSVNGDQIFQADHRNILGYNSTFQKINKLAGKELISTLGAGVRYDNSNIQLDRTIKREYLSTMVNGKLNQVNASLYADESFQATKKLKVNIGARGDIYSFNFKNNTYDTASGSAIKSIISPKLNLFYSLNKGVQLFAKSGFGFHSNDARAVIVGNLENTLARAFGNEIGSTFKPNVKMIVNVALWTLDLQSELVYVGDEGIVEISGRTRRFGMDLGVRYQLKNYLYLDADLNINKGRLRDEPSHSNRIPLAPRLTSIGGITYKKPTGLNGSLRYRYMGNRAAIEDNSITAEGYFLMDAVINYNFNNYKIGFSAENILNANWKEAQFATESRLRNEVEPVNEIHYTPGTPFFMKLSFGYNF
ncbi:MAG: TonB-dependent receptor [Bacteroidia bacterium]